MLRIGVDVGGTFTDLVLLDAAEGRVLYHKTPSTPGDPSAAIARGVAELLERYGGRADAVAFLGHGTTVATNIVIERKGARVGFITTRGFRDVLEIGRQTRPDLYDYTHDKPPPLAARRLRVEVAERLDVEGDILVALDEAAVREAARRFVAEGVNAVAIGFLHAYRNAAHERRAAAIVAEAMPGVPVSLSSEVLPEFREYERFSTTAANAYVAPRMAEYLRRFLARVEDLGIRVEPLSVHSNGGLMPVEDVRRFPVRTCLSGPAAGVVGAAAIGRAAGFPDLVTFDVGGTSTDVSLVRDGEPRFVADRQVAGYPLRVPMIDVHVIGAGGGSIARIDEGGALKVGPGSAGADPGPVAYGRGGEWVTLTDAALVLRRLNPAGLLDGRLGLDLAAARRAIETTIARPLGLSAEAAAVGVVRIAVANIARAIRAVSTERGHHLGDLALFPCGGAGPMLAAEVAAEVGCRRVVVPEAPGNLCARGILLADLTTDHVRSAVVPADAAGWARVQTLLAEIAAEAAEGLARQRVPDERRSSRRWIEARYRGQSFEVPVELPPELPPVGESLEGFLEAFAAAHRALYGYDIPGRAVEIVNLRLKAIGQVPKAPLAPAAALDRSAPVAAGRREVWFDGWASTPVYRRETLRPGNLLVGPAVIEEMGSTTLVPPGIAAAIDPFANIVMDLERSGQASDA